jgi:hypothetical protein
VALRRLGGLAIAAGLLAVSLAATVFLVGPHPKRVYGEYPLPGAGGVAVDRSLNWRVYTAFLHPVSWTRVRRFSPQSERLAPGTCTVVVDQPAGTPPEGTWPAHPPGWYPVPGRSWTFHWVAWRDSACP